MFKVCSSQYSNGYGNNQIHFPYSIATLVAYCLQDHDIKVSFSFDKVFLFKDRLHQDMKNAEGCNILMCSCYCWNWEITKALIKHVKAVNPECLVICGGPEIPKNGAHSFFEEHPYVDIIVHGEGELVLHDILLKYLEGINLETLDIAGIRTKYRTCAPRARITDINIIPSPYSSGLIWDLVDTNCGANYIVSWETNRGCPFSCTFCDWGSSTMSKVRNFSEEKIFKEIEWFGANKIQYIDCCDGNFGIFEQRDFAIAQKLAETKAATSFPHRLNLTWVKTSSERVIPIAKVLANAGMLRAVSLSIQSLSQKTLDAIKRKNLKFDNFEELVYQFKREGIQSYTEMIMGLPEETLESFKNNWNTLAGIFPQPAIMVWNCSVFVNAPMNDPEYIKRYNIEVFKSPIFMTHTSKDKGEVPEYEKMVKGTSTLPNGEIEEVYLFNWIMMVFHVFGILEFVARYYHQRYGLSFMKFYEVLMAYCKTSQGLFAREFAKAQAKAKEGYGGQGWDHYDDNLGDVSWPIEEASWLRLVRNKLELTKETCAFVSHLNNELNFGKLNTDELGSLLTFQTLILNFPEERTVKEVDATIQHDWLDYFVKRMTLPVSAQLYLKKRNKISEQDLIKWGYEAVWFGRRSQRYKMSLDELSVI